MLNAIIMAGGKGERLKNVEKPLLKICGEPIIEHVARVAEEVADEVYIATSPYTKSTEEWCLRRGFRVLRTEGLGYSLDLRKALDVVEPPALILPADTPFLTPTLLKDFLREAGGRSPSIITLIADWGCLPHKAKRDSSPIGISLIKGFGITYDNIIMCRYPDLIDIDTWEDIEEAVKICGEGRSK